MSPEEAFAREFAKAPRVWNEQPLRVVQVSPFCIAMLSVALMRGRCRSTVGSRCGAVRRLVPVIDYGVRMRERAEKAEAKLHSIERFATGLAVSYNPQDARWAGQWILDRLKEKAE